MFTKRMILAAAAVFAFSSAVLPLRADDDNSVHFKMVVSAGAKTCLPNASASVRITANGPNQDLRVSAQGLPPSTTFTLFVLQLPKAPFGVAWYQGDVETDKYGRGSARLTGIFSDETFAHAPGSGAAPVLHSQDATLGPIFNPVHMFHLGMWFDAAEDAAKAGCPATVTPFNGDHTAGIQVLNTSNFPDDQGPLRFDAAVLTKKD
jgi:hypothetical protein